jgi:urea transporter
MTDNPGNLWNREPAAVLALVGAVIALGVSFGLNLSTDQVGAIMALTAIVLGLITRTQVSPAN